MLFLVKFFLAASAIIVIILVMLQRGKGGGLAGALGGMGGQSAFGTKAGDLFTKITIGVAAFWILISVLTAIYAPYLSGGGFNVTRTNAQQNLSDTPGTEKPADSGASKADKGGKAAAPDATDKGAGDKGAADRGTKGSIPTGKLAEKLPENSVPPMPTPPAVPTPSAPTTTPPTAPAK
ncbi:MAG: preprotein translocase subunit SecG [Thermoguttaceae bacterium]|jgi:preprotein translocase subunit SecG